MKAQDYAESFIESHDFNIYVDEAYWLQAFSTEFCFRWMIDSAKDEGIELTDLEQFEYDKYFHNAYRCTEKGLS